MCKTVDYVKLYGQYEAWFILAVKREWYRCLCWGEPVEAPYKTMRGDVIGCGNDSAAQHNATFVLTKDETVSWRDSRVAHGATISASVELDVIATMDLLSQFGTSASPALSCTWNAFRWASLDWWGQVQQRNAIVDMCQPRQ
jgi:hypothetical protein